jgi:hypothetical protein
MDTVNAYRVIAEIAETNLNLKAVFATHAHPTITSA